MLREISAINEYQPTEITKRQHHSIEESLPQAPLPPTILDQTPGVALKSSIDTIEPMNEWDLRKLLLTEMGYIHGDPKDTSLDVTDSTVHLTQDSMSTSSQSSPSQSNELPSGNDMFALWSDIPTAFSW